MANVKHTNQEEYQDGLLWRAKDDGATVIGVTETALERAGELLGIELAEVGDEFEAGDWIGELQGKDDLVEILAPTALVVRERNEDMLGDLSVVEDDPTGDAWLLRVELKD